MIPWRRIASSPAPGGEELSLWQRGRELAIRAGRHVLMSSRTHGSEEALAERACAALSGRARARVLVGGLGMGFTLAAALRRLGPRAEVTLAEVSPAVVAWGRGPLGPLAGHPLRDPRVRVEIADVAEVLRPARARFDAVMLDVDNGPEALARPGNARLYAAEGLARVHAALRGGGVLAVWSAGPDVRFTRRLRAAGFEVEVATVPARARGGARARSAARARGAGPAGGGAHVIWCARRR